MGPAPVDRKSLTADSLAAAMTTMDNPIMRSRAATLGAAIRNENGVAAAVEFIERGAIHKLPSQEVV